MSLKGTFTIWWHFSILAKLPLWRLRLQIRDTQPIDLRLWSIETLHSCCWLLTECYYCGRYTQGSNAIYPKCSRFVAYLSTNECRFSRSGVANPLKLRVQQKEKSKLRGPHPGSDKRRATEASNWALLISAAGQHPRMSYRQGELIDCYSWAFTRPHNFKWHRAMMEGKVLSITIERAAR